jgi:hypothetical protein
MIQTTTINFNQKKIPWWEEREKTQTKNAMDIIIFYHENRRFPHVTSKNKTENKLARILLLYRNAEKSNSNKYLIARELLNKYLT